MLFASSKEAIRRALVGVAVEIQGTDSSEVAHEAGQQPPLHALFTSILMYFLVLDKAKRIGQ